MTDSAGSRSRDDFSQRMLDAVLEYAARGWRVFPIRPQCKFPPLITDWPNQATCDADTIRAGHQRWPLANWGVACGEGSGFMVADPDARDGAPGLATWGTLCGRYGEIATLRTSTPFEGWHVYFQWRAGLKNRTRWAPGCDFKTDGGYVLVPPSRIERGGQLVEYAWLDPLDTPLAQMPDWLFQTLSKDTNPSTPRGTPVEGPGADGSRLQAVPDRVADIAEGVPAGARNESLYRYGCRHAGRGATADEIRVLVSDANSRCSPPLDAEELERVLESIFKQETDFPLTDEGNVDRLWARNGQTLRYLREQGNWMEFRGHQWVLDETDTVAHDRVVETIRAIPSEEADPENNTARAKALRKHAHASEAGGRMDAMERHARRDGRFLVRKTQMDANPMLLGLPNGVLDLETGRLLAGRPEQWITQQAGSPFHQGARCPTWEQFLIQTFWGHEELIPYMQRLAGYCLTGLTREEIIIFGWGSGRNGKSTLVETLHELLGSYARVTSPETFMRRRAGQVSNELARLAGARFVACPETGKDRFFDEQTIKQITGGETITARFLYKEPFQFVPRLKLCVTGNYQPTIEGIDEGIWRRIHLVPFANTIDQDKRNTKLKEQLLTELPGILNWALTGCLEWQKHGLGMPEIVRESVREYRQDMDPFAGWMAECVQIKEDAITSFAALYRSYHGWCRLNGVTISSTHSVGSMLKTRFKPHRTSHERQYIGLHLRRDDPE